MNQPHLPLWEKVIFVDWHGVMSTDRFWESVLAQRTSLGSSLRTRLAELFSSDSGTIDGWMRGKVTTTEVIEPTRRHLGNTRGVDFLERRIVEDCRLMAVDAELASLFTSLRDRVLIVLATDNTVEFETAFRAASRAASAQSTSKVLIDPTLNRVAQNFDDILCSATIGVLKAEDPEAFFGSWLEENSVPFCNSLLVDDRSDNCQAFRGLGGSALEWDDASASRPERLASISDFVGTPQESGNHLPNAERSCETQQPPASASDLGTAGRLFDDPLMRAGSRALDGRALRQTPALDRTFEVPHQGDFGF